MKKILFATTALAGLAFAGVASADIAMFGDARLGLGYNINNDGSAQGDEDLRAVSRVRIGAAASGETDTGITYGASIRFDNAAGGQGALNGQTAGEVFVSGSFGTLTYGDTNAADEQNVGDAIGGVGITGLGDLNETLFISNGGGFGDDDQQDFANNPFARPTVRYDYNFGGLGVSASTNRDLTDVGVGLSYTADLFGGSITGGLGYYDYSEFTIFGTTAVVVEGLDGQTVVLPGAEEAIVVEGGEQYSATVKGTFEMFEFGVVYSNASSQNSDLEAIVLGLGTSFDRFSVNGFYHDILDGTGNAEFLDGNSAYGAGVAYDLGGGARLAGGVARTLTDDTVGDFGIGLTF